MKNFNWKKILIITFIFILLQIIASICFSLLISSNCYYTCEYQIGAPSPMIAVLHRQGEQISINEYMISFISFVIDCIYTLTTIYIFKYIYNKLHKNRKVLFLFLILFIPVFLFITFQLTGLFFSMFDEICISGKQNSILFICSG
jgi:hypothetical protein